MQAKDKPKEKRKRVVLTASQKKEIVIYMEQRDQVSNANVAKIFSNKLGVEIARRTITDIYRSKENINIHFWKENILFWKY